MKFSKNTLALAVMAATVSLAQTSPVLAENTLSEKGRATLLNKVVVSATRTEQSIEDVSSSVASVSADEMDANLASDIQDAVKYVPGVSVAGNGRFGLNGFNIRGMDKSRVKVMVDGVEQPVSYNPGADQMRFNQNMYETDTLAAIEINKGPASSLYGSDALGGAVLMRTKNPEDLLAPSGDDSYAGFKTGYTSADQSFKQTLSLARRAGNWETLLIYTHTDGKETSTHGDGADINGRDRGAADPYDYNQNNILGKVFYQFNDDHRVGLTGEFFERDGEGRILSNEGYEMMPGFTYTNNFGVDEDTRKRVGIEHEWLAGNTAFDSLHWQASWQEIDSEHNTKDHTEKYGNRNRQRVGKDISYQFDVQLDKELLFASSVHQLSYGLSAMKDSFELHYSDTAEKPIAKPAEPEIPAADSTKWGIFVQDQAFFMDDALIVTGGVRYDSFKAEPDSSSGKPDASSDAITGKLGAVFHWNDNISSFVQFSQGFKAPTLQDLYYFKDKPNEKIILNPNPDLKPEESNSYEIGLRGQNHLGNFELVGFYNDYTNFIDTDKEKNLVTEVTTHTKVNVGSAEIYGAELSGMLYLDEAFDAPTGMYSRMSIAYVEGENGDNGGSLDTVAPLTTVVGIGYDAPSEIWGGALDVTHVSGKTGSDWSEEHKDNVDAPAYTVVDLTAYYQPMENMMVRGGLFNALDEKYWLYQDVTGTPVTSDQGIDRKTQPGRNWGVSLSYDF
ncbi:TonB-dependent hemoglobin/transferrin/lactoferrin family receptor [Endozoicomonas sp. SESOKO1]|uniref:TonB-dependent hemoglobin/transferrin/lactoferrin family receptor n=1 Tax=Endozoicomonas sp. SESOKO1 TaxID=2828742 RepID=UPI002148DE54|nr:TonB-dependent hemoglobin/transferrin/lactoferrin family receptor [Endozoicomonas sp. SESOKO1]